MKMAIQQSRTALRYHRVWDSGAPNKQKDPGNLLRRLGARIAHAS